MEWQDHGTILSVRKHGENSVIVEAFTAEHGRHAGVIRGGTSRKNAPHLQPGGHVALTWKARLEDHLGSYSFEPLKSRAPLMNDRLALAGLSSLAVLLQTLLPEREPHGYLYQETENLLEAMGQNADWPLQYLHWELSLLEELGFALDLSSCAVTGGTQDLCYVSPKTGRAVSREGAGEWASRLLPLPRSMLSAQDYSAEDVAQGLRTTGYFLSKIAAELSDRELPTARQRFIDRLTKKAPQNATPS